MSDYSNWWSKPWWKRIFGFPPEPPWNQRKLSSLPKTILDELGPFAIPTGKLRWVGKELEQEWTSDIGIKWYMVEHD